MAMLPALTWGAILFGFRVLAMMISSVLATSLAHFLLKRTLAASNFSSGWERAGQLVYGHSLVSALVLVGLAQPGWPVWIVAAAALLIPLVHALIGGPARERVHVAVVAAVALQFFVVPMLPALKTYAGAADAVLARDRLLMGDIRDQHSAKAGPLDPWPLSRDLRGNDAVPVELPSAVAAEALDKLSGELAELADFTSTGLSHAAEMSFQEVFNNAFSTRLPPMDLLVLGVSPGRIGTVSLMAVVLAGLYLSYRYILRPRSVVIFVLSFILGNVPIAIWPSTIAHVGVYGIWSLLRTFPGEILTLVNYLLLSSDAGFAAVFILALPGTEPLTSRGRRIFLVVAGLLGAILHRFEPTIPAATLALCVLMPFARLFDRMFGERSWLAARA
jgi:Na+-translocating ferredoxin:NAD+ oxidoreductase RnfD subunit